MINFIFEHWVALIILIQLITALVIIQLNRQSGVVPKRYSTLDWLVLICSSFAFPLSWIIIFSEKVWPWLVDVIVKERELF